MAAPFVCLRFHELSFIYAWLYNFCINGHWSDDGSFSCTRRLVLLFPKIYGFLLNLRFFLPAILTMMHLRIILYTSWTPLWCDILLHMTVWTESRPISS